MDLGQVDRNGSWSSDHYGQQEFWSHRGNREILLKYCSDGVYDNWTTAGFWYFGRQVDP